MATAKPNHEVESLRRELAELTKRVAVLEEKKALDGGTFSTEKPKLDFSSIAGHTEHAPHKLDFSSIAGHVEHSRI